MAAAGLVTVLTIGEGETDPEWKGLQNCIITMKLYVLIYIDVYLDVLW